MRYNLINQGTSEARLVRVPQPVPGYHVAVFGDPVLIADDCTCQGRYRCGGCRRVVDCPRVNCPQAVIVADVTFAGFATGGRCVLLSCGHDLWDGEADAVMAGIPSLAALELAGAR